jgi:hypothetical protein
MLKLNTIIFLGVVVSLISIYMLTNQEEVKNQNKPLVGTTTHVVTYKALLSEKKVVSKMQKIQDTQEIETIKSEADNIIAKADKFIKEKNLVLDSEIVSKSELKKQQAIKADLEIKIKKLEELSNEN